jgi:hypothetical protein
MSYLLRSTIYNTVVWRCQRPWTATAATQIPILSLCFRAVPKDLFSKECNQSLFSKPLFGLVRDEGLLGPAQEIHFILHDSAIGIAQIPGIGQPEEESRWYKTFIIVDGDAIDSPILMIRSHPCENHIGVQLRIGKKTIPIGRAAEQDLVALGAASRQAVFIDPSARLDVLPQQRLAEGDHQI